MTRNRGEEYALIAVPSAWLRFSLASRDVDVGRVLMWPPKSMGAHGSEFDAAEIK